MDAVVFESLRRDAVTQSVLPRTLGELRAFVGLAAKSGKRVDTTITDLFARIAQVTDTLFLSALEKRTATEFHATATSVFDNYIHILRAKSDLLKVALHNDMDRAEGLIHQSLSELEADFRDQGTERFGVTVNDQAMF